MPPFTNMQVSLFYPSSDDETGHIRAIVRARNVSAMLEMGWSKVPQEVEEFKPATTDPDKGDGVPGSMEWHQNQLAAMQNKDEISAYLDSAGVSIHKGGTLDTVKAKALEALRKADGNGS